MLLCVVLFSFKKYSLLGCSLAVDHIAMGARGLGFDYRAGQIGHSVANGSLPLRRFFGAVLPRRQAVEMCLATRYTLRRNTASIMKI